MLAEPELLEALKALSPLAFEQWIAARFREDGNSVVPTLASGDHGVDLVVTKESETVLVQCKRYRAMRVGEPVLRDLYGALHHARATRAIVVTTGHFTRGALEWAQGKAIGTWDGHELVRRWPSEIEELARQTPVGASPKGIKARRGDNWFVYTSDDGRRWAVKASPLIGNNPALGFERLDDPTLPELPERLGPGRAGRPPGLPVRRIRMRLIILQAVDHPKKPIRYVPVGTKEAWDPMLHRRGTHVLLARSDGTLERTMVVNHKWEHVTHDSSWLRVRARGEPGSTSSTVALPMQPN